MSSNVRLYEPEVVVQLSSGTSLTLESHEVTLVGRKTKMSLPGLRYRLGKEEEECLDEAWLVLEPGRQKEWMPSLGRRGILVGVGLAPDPSDAEWTMVPSSSVPIPLSPWPRELRL